MDFEKMFQEIQNLQLRLDRAKKDLAEKRKALDDVCKPVFVKAAKEYNRSARLRIVLKAIRLGIAVGAKKIDMEMRLQTVNGGEPDEDLTYAEFGDVVSGYRTILDKELQVAGIPLTLGTVLAPPGYYPK